MYRIILHCMPRAIIFNPDAAETISDYSMQRVEFSCSSGGHATGATNEQVTGLIARGLKATW